MELYNKYFDGISSSFSGYVKSNSAKELSQLLFNEFEENYRQRLTSFSKNHTGIFIHELEFIKGLIKDLLSRTVNLFYEISTHKEKFFTSKKPEINCDEIVWLASEVKLTHGYLNERIASLANSSNNLLHERLTILQFLRILLDSIAATFSYHGIYISNTPIESSFEKTFQIISESGEKIRLNIKQDLELDRQTINEKDLLAENESLRIQIVMLNKEVKEKEETIHASISELEYRLKETESLLASAETENKGLITKMEILKKESQELEISAYTKNSFSFTRKLKLLGVLDLLYKHYENKTTSQFAREVVSLLRSIEEFKDVTMVKNIEAAIRNEPAPSNPLSSKSEMKKDTKDLRIKKWKID